MWDRLTSFTGNAMFWIKHQAMYLVLNVNKVSWRLGLILTMSTWKNFTSSWKTFPINNGASLQFALANTVMRLCAVVCLFYTTYFLLNVSNEIWIIDRHTSRQFGTRRQAALVVTTPPLSHEIIWWEPSSSPFDGMPLYGNNLSHSIDSVAQTPT
jgi:hypothetical protein